MDEWYVRLGEGFSIVRCSEGSLAEYGSWILGGSWQLLIDEKTRDAHKRCKNEIEIDNRR